MRSSFALLFASFGAIAAVTNCTVKSVEDDGTGGTTTTKCTPGDSKECTCTNGKQGAQECNTKGSGYAACVCDGIADSGGASNAGEGGAGNAVTGGTGGTVSTAGTAAVGVGGASEGGARDVGVGGAGGASAVEIDPTDCAGCLETLCADEFAACDADADCPDQFIAVNDCINTARGDGLVKRDAVRGCGVTIGASPDPSTPSGDVWAPPQMAQATTNLINCMASGDANDVSWANDDANFSPTIVPWKDGTCAKLACTSQVK